MFPHSQVDKVEAIRIPVNQDKAPDEECFDQIVSLLKNTSASTPIVFNCQVLDWYIFLFKLFSKIVLGWY